MTFADSYAFFDEWAVQALQEPRHRGDLRAAQRHREPGGQDRRRRAEAARQRRRAAPRDDGVRHGRRAHGRGAAHRPREAQRQGHQERGEARRPAALADRALPRRDHRRDDRHIPRAAWTRRRRDHRRGVRRGRAARRREVRHRRVAATGFRERGDPPRSRAGARGRLALLVVRASWCRPCSGSWPSRRPRWAVSAARARHPERVGADRPGHRVDAVGGALPADRDGDRRGCGARRRGRGDAGGLRQPARRAGRRRGLVGRGARGGDGDRARARRVRRGPVAVLAFVGGLLATLLVYVRRRARTGAPRW